MITRLTKLVSWSAGFALVVSTSLADVTLHNLFTHNMVLQQQASVPIWGWAEHAEEITVTFQGQTARTRAEQGAWMVRFKNLQAGGPYELVVSGRNTIRLTNVMVGEVWVASGQSNMQFPLRASYNAQEEIARSANPNLRLYTVPRLKADKPTNNVDGAWVVCGPETSPDFSAVAYYFGRDLQKALRVPVGIIHTSWGGSPAEVWMSRTTLEANPEYKRDILDAYEKSYQAYLQQLEQYNKRKAEAAQAGKPFNQRPPRAPWKPTELYNGMIAPLIPHTIKGAIWYQGESNAGRAYQYRSLFADMIRNWRRDWGQGNFPFLLVQLAPFRPIQNEPGESTWAELREAQLLATRILPNVGMAVIIDVGDERDIHPKRKEPVGARLALAARGIAYHENIVYSGPIYRSMEVTGREAIISFDHVGSGLVARPVMTNGVPAPGLWERTTGMPLTDEYPLAGFAVAGADRKFVWARAAIRGDKVVVTSPKVEHPIAVRYGWADYPVVNLWNKEGLPASPFRTDNFPMITAPQPAASAPGQ